MISPITGTLDVNQQSVNNVGTFTMGANKAIVLAAVSGVPAQYSLYRENIGRVWGDISVTPSINDHFNLTSVADAGVGLVTVTIDRDYNGANYPIVASFNTTGAADVQFCSIYSKASGSFNVEITSDAGVAADKPFALIGVGGLQG